METAEKAILMAAMAPRTAENAIGRPSFIGKTTAYNRLRLADVLVRFDAGVDISGGTVRLQIMKRRPVAIPISGRGSNMAALIAATQRQDYPASIAIVISNRPEASVSSAPRPRGGEQCARPPVVRRSLALRFRAAETDRRSGAELVACAGYMQIATPQFVEAYAGRMINIHPALPPPLQGARHPCSGACRRGADPWVHCPFRDNGNRQRSDHRPGGGAGDAGGHAADLGRAGHRRRAQALPGRA